MVEQAEVVLLDFDGPVCRVFAGKTAPSVAANLRHLIRSRGVKLPDDLRDQDDPLELLRGTAAFAPELVDTVSAALEAAEVEAVATAETTIGAFDVVRACLATGRALSIVSNNSTAAINAYLARRDRARHFAAIIGRGHHPDLMKPSPLPVVQALQALNVRPTAAVLVGDSPTDIEAAHAAGVAAIGYANKPGKIQRLAVAGADAIITDMGDLGAALAATRRPKSRLSWVESDGGPLVVVPESVLAQWRGVPNDFDPGDLDTWGDYGRACQVDGRAGSLEIGDGQALVLGDEPASTTYLSAKRLFVRWIHGASEEQVIRLIPKAMETAAWEEVGTWTTRGRAQLFDSALAGDELEHGRRLVIDVAPGTYRIRTAYAEPASEAGIVLVQLTT
ncbi:Imm21 family immunity protein [Micromonospora sp. NPDC050980]|uniref:Imm21 family immunity protein n=1 Tax=Micromonospora sp. NPDC050980 TaxID=3155161 RepID=UPI0033E7064F